MGEKWGKFRNRENSENRASGGKLTQNRKQRQQQIAKTLRKWGQAEKQRKRDQIETNAKNGEN